MRNIIVNILNLTTQELKIINYLSSLEETEIPWTLLAQFAKDPQTVKYKSMQKAVSEIKRKYKNAGLPTPFKVAIAAVEEPKTSVATPATIPTQTLVQVKKTPAGNAMIVGNNLTKNAAQLDFGLDLNTKSVKTKYGACKLNDNEWYMFKYLHENAGRLIKISELRDKIMYPKYGSKLPARWFDHIMRVINNMRRQVSGLNARLLTVKSDETCYLFQ